MSDYQSEIFESDFNSLDNLLFHITSHDEEFILAGEMTNLLFPWNIDSKLDLSQLSELESQYCIIDPTLNSLETPLLKNAVMVMEGIYTHEILNRETLSMFLYRIYDGEYPYKMNSFLFAQLASLILSNEWHKGKILLLAGNTKLSACILLSNKISEMKYISGIDLSNIELLQKSSFMTKGQWAIKIGQDSYLGLSTLGIQIKSLKEWLILETYESIR